VVDYGDDAGVANAILRLLETPKEVWQAQFESARRDLTWEQVARPLIEFCRHPRRALDKVALGNRLGNPYYIHHLEIQQQEIIRLREFEHTLLRYHRMVPFRIYFWLKRLLKNK